MKIFDVHKGKIIDRFIGLDGFEYIMVRGDNIYQIRKRVYPHQAGKVIGELDNRKFVKEIFETYRNRFAAPNLRLALSLFNIS
jgi:hypothetical protein